MDESSSAYPYSSTFWGLLIRAPILWGLVIYLLARILIPGFR